MTTTDKRDWLAIILIGAGSSFARGPDRADTIGRCLSICKSDWGSIFDLDGKPVSVNVYDVTGYETISWDARGLRADGEYIDVPHEVEKWTFAERNRRDHQRAA